MLILTRRVGETLMINDDITVRVLERDGSQVRLGIIAPPDVAIHLRELYDKITEERKGRGVAGTAASVSLAKGEAAHA